METEETTGEEGDSSSWMDLPLSSASKGANNKKRFSEEQIKQLESMFQTQTKLEPRQKLQLAKELNLEPRQVAIWFQNKRARWKAKKLEREFSVLKTEYDSLLCSFEGLKKEKQVLLKQMQKLAELLEKQQQVGHESGNSNHSKNVETTAIRNDSFTPPPCSESDGQDRKLMTCLSDQDEQHLYTWQRGEARLNNSDEVQMQFGFQSNFDPMCNTQQLNSQWWDFWPIKQ